MLTNHNVECSKSITENRQRLTPNNSLVLSVVVGLISFMVGCSQQPSNAPTKTELSGFLSGDGGSILTLDLGQVSALTTTERTITLNNPSSEPLEEIQTSFSDPSVQFKGGDFPGQGGTCSTTLAAQSSCTLVIIYSSGPMRGIGPRLGITSGGRNIGNEPADRKFSVSEYQILLAFRQGGVQKKNLVSILVRKEIIPFQAAPVASPQAMVISNRNPVAIILNATSAEGDSALTYKIVSDPKQGTLSGTPPNVTYTPKPGYLGDDSFSFLASNGKKDSNTAEISIKVVDGNQTPIQAAPVANPQAMIISNRNPVAIILNATSADGDSTLTYKIVSDPKQGTLSGTPPNVTYTPKPGYLGDDSFSFLASNGKKDSNTAEISIKVVDGNQTPIPESQTITVIRDTALPITLKASDPDGDPITFLMTSQPKSGTLTGTAPNLTYRPNTGFTGTDSFGFRVVDDRNSSASAVITLNVLEIGQFHFEDSDRNTVTDLSFEHNQVFDRKTISIVASNNAVPFAPRFIVESMSGDEKDFRVSSRCPLPNKCDVTITYSGLGLSDDATLTTFRNNSASSGSGYSATIHLKGKGFESQIAMGRQGTCTLSDGDKGILICWAHETTIENPRYSDLKRENLYSRVAVSENRICAIGSRVDCWGQVIQIPPISNARQIALGLNHICVIDDSDNLNCWGSNSSGQLNVPPLTNVRQVVAAGDSTCALSDEGSTCWGTIGNITDPIGRKNFDYISISNENFCGILNGNLECRGKGHLNPEQIQRLLPGVQRVITRDDSLVVQSGSQLWVQNSKGLVLYGEDTKLKNFAAGPGGVCSVRAGRGISCWGTNEDDGSLTDWLLLKVRANPIGLRLN